VEFLAGLPVLFTVLAACSSSAMQGTPDASSGGASAGATGGAATGGTSGSAASAAGTFTGSSGGASATGGSTTVTTYDPSSSLCNPAATHLCTSTPPPSALISDFSTPPGASSPVVFGSWGQSIIGGTYVYPAVPATPGPCDSPITYPITQTLTGGNWTISGTVGTYSGMGLWWACNTGTSESPNYVGICLLDASAYTGISFKVSGDAGPKGTISLQVGTPSTMKPSLDYAGNPKDCGTCTTSTCGSSVPITVTSDPTTVSFTWPQLGVTEANAVEMILFMLADPCDYSSGTCVSHPFPVNVTIDDMTFTN
jgi:hypothetical protein